MAEIIEIKTASQFDELLKTDKPVLVDFWATWCYPCKMQAPIVHALAEEIGDKAVIAKVDVDENEESAINYRISSIPTIIVIKNGEVVEKTVGVTEKESLMGLIAKHL